MEFPRMCPARWLSDQEFMGLPPHDFSHPFYDMHSNYYRSWKSSEQSAAKEFNSTIENEKGNFKITLDVQHFRPEEIAVKVSNNEIIVEGKHEERPDTHGFITRQFKRRYPLPSQFPAENVTSMLSSDGVLTILAERQITKETSERIIPIKMCGTYPRKTQIETKIDTDTTKMSEKENFKISEDIISKSKNQAVLKEDHSRLLLKPELLKDTKSDTNGTCTEKTTMKESIDIMKTSERVDPLNICSTTSKIEESIGKSIMGLTALTEQLGHSSIASSSEIIDKKIASEMSGSLKAASEMSTGLKAASEMSDSLKAASEKAGMTMKSTLEACGMKDASQFCGTKEASDICSMKAASDSFGMKSTSEMSATKGASELAATKTASEMLGMKGMSKTVIEESSSSYKSSSMMSSSTKISGKTGECVSDIISAELREAAENV